MSKFKYFLLPTALASFVTTAGFAGGVALEEDRFLTRTVHMGSEDISPIKTGKQGWSGPEITHRWSDSKEAILIIPRMDGERNLYQVKINMSPFANQDHPQRIAVFNRFNEYEDTVKPSPENLKTYTGTPVSISIDILDRPYPHLTILQENEVIYFHMPDACKPAVLDPNNLDPRTFGCCSNNCRT